MIDFDKIARRWRKCWHVAPDVYLLLKESVNVEESRQKLMNYLNATEMSFRNDFYELSNAEFVLFNQALQVLKNLFSKRCERIARNSPIQYLWAAACQGDNEDVNDDFIDEFEHLFRAIKGNSTVYPSYIIEGTVPPDFNQYKGRQAAVKRSDFLEDLGAHVERHLIRYPSGMEPQVMAKRAENKKRILDIFGADERDWNDYKWQFRNVIRDEKGLERLKQVVRVSAEEEKSIRISMNNNIPFAVTPHYLHLMDEESGQCDYAIRRQVFPPLAYSETMVEHQRDRSFKFDFMREHDTSPCDLITRRYPKVAIFKPVDTCPQICVYCQRNWEIQSFTENVKAAGKQEIDGAIQWVKDHPQVIDLLVTGGDPLAMNNQFIENLLSQLADIPHLQSIRLATRTPATVPQRFDDELLDILERYHGPDKLSIHLVTHFAHPYEICPETAKAVQGLRKRGIMIYNQQVFTFANSRRFESVALRIALKHIGVDPYYAFNMKGKSEMAEYSVPVARLLQERKEEARLLPGIYRTDEPVFNVPFLGKNYVRAGQDHEMISITPQGERVYAFHPWEKNIRAVDPYIYTDISLRGYLQKLEERGEDLDEYRSIWYYY